MHTWQEDTEGLVGGGGMDAASTKVCGVQEGSMRKSGRAGGHMPEACPYIEGTRRQLMMAMDTRVAAAAGFDN